MIESVVRNGYLLEREIQTGLGGIKVRVPRTRDRNPGGESEEAIRFRSSLVPLYLKGISTGDFREALSAFLGPDGLGLSAKTISRLKQKWMQDYEKWRQRDLSKKRYVYWWEQRHC